MNADKNLNLCLSVSFCGCFHLWWLRRELSRTVCHVHEVSSASSFFSKLINNSFLSLPEKSPKLAQIPATNYQLLITRYHSPVYPGYGRTVGKIVWYKMLVAGLRRGQDQAEPR
jgi:hypothetical protein